jgi:SAM-dependent methyltransferase
MTTMTRLSLILLPALLVACRMVSNAPQATPRVRPAYEEFTREQAVRMEEAATTSLAPVYPCLAEYVVERFHLADKRGIGIDIGAGPGSLVLELCRRTPGFYWINADINTHHAESFFRKAITNGCAYRLGLVFADVHHLPFRNDYADMVVSRGSFPFWGDQRTAFAEIHRVLKPGGHAFIGRGFPPNLPIEVAKEIRAKQGKGMPAYDVQETAGQLRALMRTLKISDYEILRPRSDQSLVNYGVWVHFSKSPR